MVDRGFKVSPDYLRPCLQTTRFKVAMLKWPMDLVSKCFPLGRQFFSNSLSAKYTETYLMDADPDFQGVKKTTTQSGMVLQFQVYQATDIHLLWVFINSYCRMSSPEVSRLPSSL